MPKSSARLGEKLLGLIPRPKDPNQPKIKKPSLSALSLAFGLLNSLTGLLCLTVLAALCGTGVLTLLNMEAKALEGNQRNDRRVVCGNASDLPKFAKLLNKINLP